MTRLINDVSPSNLVAYKNLLVGFYDSFKEQGFFNEKTQQKEIKKEPTLYIHIQINDDKNTIQRRQAGTIKIRNQFGDLTERDEIEVYQLAYEKYLKAKSQEGEIDYKAQAEELAKKVADLEKRNAEKVSVAEIKQQLDELGIEYKGNASRVELEGLLLEARKSK